MRSPVGALVFILLLFALDIYVYQAVRGLLITAQPKTRTLITLMYWGLVILTIAAFLAFIFTAPDFPARKIRAYVFAIIVGLLLAKLSASIFLLIDDIRRGIQWSSYKLFYKAPIVPVEAGQGISRSTFLSWLGLATGSTLFGSLLYGFSNKYNYQVKRLSLSFTNLPEAFKGLRILHISDIHSGSFTDISAVERGVQKILDEKPDLILFTGDLVNDRASEMESYMDIFSRLKAPMGVYSTLGNHDYGDYVSWPQGNLTKEQNLQNLKEVHEKLGWRLLMNEHVALERGNQSIALLGIENWSAKSAFPKRGRLDLAHAGAENHPFKILLSHDPSHWEAEVCEHYKDIDLTLSGHTHGMQFGVELPGFRWSPVQYVYRQWAGLYQEGQQKLYVNRGFGFLGYPGRVGILPEITVINLT